MPAPDPLVELAWSARLPLTGLPVGTVASVNTGERQHARGGRRRLQPVTELPSNGDENVGVAAWAALLRTQATVVKVLSEELERTHGISLAFYDVLLVLYYAPSQRLRIQELGDQVVLSRSRVSRLVEEMTRAGLLRRDPDPSDGRAAFAALTPVGRSAFRRAAPHHMQAIVRAFSQHISRRELDAIRSGLEKVLVAHGQQPGTPRSDAASPKRGDATPRRRGVTG